MDNFFNNVSGVAYWSQTVCSRTGAGDLCWEKSTVMLMTTVLSVGTVFGLLYDVFTFPLNGEIKSKIGQ